MKNLLKLPAIALALLACIATGCLEREFSASGLILAVDEEVLTVLPEAPLANPDAPFDSLVLDTLTIRANRSWSATLDGQDTDWIRLRSDEFLNLAENERAIPLVLECKRNFDRMPRGVNLVISTPDGSLTVPVVQTAAEYRLDAELTRTELVSMLDTTVLKVRCNTAWTISLVDPAAAAFVSFSTTQGTDNEAVKVMFDENIDLEAGREVQVKVSAEDCEDKIVTISQRQASPYAKFKVEPMELPIEVDSYTFPFSVNVPWTAERKGNFKKVKLNPASGGPTSGGMMKFSFEAGGDPGVYKRDTIIIYPEGGEPESFVVSQQGCIHLDFQDWVSPATDASYDGTNKAYVFHWPFAYPPQNAFGGSYSSTPNDPAKYPYATTDSNHPILTSFYSKVGLHEFQVFCRIATNSSGTKTGGIWINTTKQGLQIGSTRYDYIVTPVVRGAKLVKVIYEPAYLVTVYVAIREHDPDRLYPGTRPTDIVPGGEMWKSTGGSTKKVTAEMMENHVFNLRDTEAEKSYRISLEGSPTTASALKDLILIYEPVTE